MNLHHLSWLPFHLHHHHHHSLLHDNSNFCGKLWTFALQAIASQLELCRCNTSPSKMCPHLGHFLGDFLGDFFLFNPLLIVLILLYRRSEWWIQWKHVLYKWNERMFFCFAAELMLHSQKSFAFYKHVLTRELHCYNILKCLSKGITTYPFSNYHTNCEGLLLAMTHKKLWHMPSTYGNSTR